MHSAHSLRRIVILLVLCIGSFHTGLNAEVEEPDVETLQKNHTVYVEPKEEVTTSKETGERILSPYMQRRDEWSVLIGFDYSNYEPINYQPNFSINNYRTIYGAPGLPMTEFQFTVMRNWSPVAIGGELSAGVFQNGHSDPAGVNSILGLTQFRVGAVAALSSIYKEPYVVPYVSGGGYVMYFKEKLGGNSFTGNTQIAPYMNAGVAFTLDWVDRKAASEGFEDSGLQSSYLYLEARKYMASAKAQDPDFGNTLNFTAGVRIEF